MSFVADLHLHSSYAYATSSALDLENLAHWAKLKGIDLLATADFTHPVWFQDLRSSLKEGPEGTYRFQGTHFVMGTEISCVYRQDGRGRRVHLLVFAPSMEVAARISDALQPYGNLQFDGRPVVSLSARELALLLLEISTECLLVPAHAWTPWYGIFGSKSGFDSLAEAFGDMAVHVPAIETGLSSDPEMNWMLPELADKTIVSFSDAHSLPKLGRELTVFAGNPDYESLTSGLRTNQVEFTVEMYPEEGKYHYDGHRKCGISQHPDFSPERENLCPECGRPLTLGVLHRVSSLGGTPSPGQTKISTEVRGGLPAGAVTSPDGRPPFVRMVPLVDLVAAVRKKGQGTKTVMREYHSIVEGLGTEMRALLWATVDELAATAGEEMAAAIVKARAGEVKVEPGYDGVYGKVFLPM